MSAARSHLHLVEEPPVPYRIRHDFRAIRKRARHDETLSHQARHLFEDVCELAERDGFCQAGDKHFAEAYGTSRRTVRRWVAELKAAGYIAVEGRTNSRTITPAEPAESAPNLGHDLGQDDVLNDANLGHSGAANLGHPGVDTKSIYNSREQQHASRTREEAADGDRERSDAAAAFDEGLVSLLASTGIDRPVAERLAAAHPDRIGPMVERFEAERPGSPGWLVRAIEENYQPKRTKPSGPQLLTHAEMLARWKQRGGNGETGRRTEDWFETLDTPDGKRWRER